MDNYFERYEKYERQHIVDFENEEFDDEFDERFCTIEYEIDKFITFESDNILDLYFDLRNKYTYFLNKMNSGDLLSFILDQKFGKSKTKKCTNIDQFLYYYNDEINTVEYVLNKTSKYKFNKDDLILFCYKYTDQV